MLEWRFVSRTIWR